MDHIRPVASTSAPLRGVPQYTDREQEYFGTIEETEARFSRYEGEDIPPDYLIKLSEMLNEIATFVSPSTTYTTEQGFSTPVFDTLIKYVRNYLPQNESDVRRNLVNLQNMNTRPCFAGHHFALVFLYWLINRCVKYKRLLILCEPLETTSALLAKYMPDIFEKHDYDKNYECDMQKAALLEANALGIEHLFTISDDDTITLRSSAFPTAAELNSSDFVAEHQRKKSRTR